MGRVISQYEAAQATKLAPPFTTPCLLLDGKIVLKTGDTFHEAEANAMMFVRTHTSIPVPEVYRLCRDVKSGHVCIVMEYVAGDQLSSVWERLTADDKDTILSQLRCYLKELCQLKGTFIGTADGSGCNDQFFSIESVCRRRTLNPRWRRLWSRGRVCFLDPGRCASLQSYGRTPLPVCSAGSNAPLYATI